MSARAPMLGLALLLGACESADAVSNPVPVSSAGSDTNGAPAAEAASDAATRPKVLVFSRTTAFRHASIPAGIEAIRGLGARYGWDVDATEDAARFSAEGLAPFAAIVFLSTSGDVLDEAQEAAFERYVARGGGFVGIHAATDTEYEWPFYDRLIGAHFLRHPAGTPRGTLRITDHAHPSTAHLGETWTRSDEWYAFRRNPREEPALHVLLTLDEESVPLDDPFRMGDHPLAWFQAFGGGRAFVTALGHTEESFREPAFLAHIGGGIAWAATGARAPLEVAHELDGVTPVAQDAWRPHASPPFTFTVAPGGMSIVDAGGRNEHLTRQGLTLPAGSSYTVEALFTISGAPKNGLLDELNSFCVSFDIQGQDGRADDLEHLYARSLNLDLSRATPHTGVVKTMGFVDGGFRTTGEHVVTGVDFDVEYRMTIDVNTDARGLPRADTAMFRLTRGATTIAAFPVDFRGFPYAADPRFPVRVGVNTHGTDWTMRDFRVVRRRAPETILPQGR